MCPVVRKFGDVPLVERPGDGLRGTDIFLGECDSKTIGVFNDDIEAQTIIGTQDLMSIDLPGFTRPVTCDLLEGADDFVNF